MTRTLLLLAALAFAVPHSWATDPSDVSAAAAPAGGIAWDDSGHKSFFNYQRYLVSSGLNGLTPEAWKALSSMEQAAVLRKTEAFLRAKLAQLMQTVPLAGADRRFAKAVWGEDLEAALKRVAAANNTGDPMQIKLAVRQAVALTQQLGDPSADWMSVFDGGNGRNQGEPSGPPQESEGGGLPDLLAVEKKPDFLDMLASPAVARILSSPKAYVAFLQEKGVAAEAMPSMLAMYQVLKGADKGSGAELQHILPTVVAFLLDGKTVLFDKGGNNKEGREHALGEAIPGDYDRPQAVVVMPMVMGADPVVVGKTLAHEFQHIYDMYIGRYYTLDSEMRGFKVAALYFKTLKERSPEKFAALMASDDDFTRGLMRDVESFTRDYDESSVKFREAVAVRYQQREEGVFMGRMSLRESVDPTLESGAVVDLATDRSRLEAAKREVAELEERQRRLAGEYTANSASRELARELEKVTKDLVNQRVKRDMLDQTVIIEQIRLKRMQAEAAWMDRRAEASERAADEHDLTLAVDRSYMPR